MVWTRRASLAVHTSFRNVPFVAHSIHPITTVFRIEIKELMQFDGWIVCGLTNGPQNLDHLFAAGVGAAEPESRHLSAAGSAFLQTFAQFRLDSGRGNAAGVQKAL